MVLGVGYGTSRHHPLTEHREQSSHVSRLLLATKVIAILSNNLNLATSYTVGSSSCVYLNAKPDMFHWAEPLVMLAILQVSTNHQHWTRLFYRKDLSAISTCQQSLPKSCMIVYDLVWSALTSLTQTAASFRRHLKCGFHSRSIVSH